VTKTDLQLVDDVAQMLERIDPGAYVARLTEGTSRSITIDGTFYFDSDGKLIHAATARQLREDDG